jgi:hypothetical protein
VELSSAPFKRSHPSCLALRRKKLGKVANSLQDRRSVQAAVPRDLSLVGQTAAEASFRFLGYPRRYHVPPSKRGQPNESTEHPGRQSCRQAMLSPIQAGPSVLKQNAQQLAKPFALGELRL